MSYLFLDVPNLCYRAFFTTGALRYDDEPTGTIFGFLRDVLTIPSLLSCNNLAFFFDAGPSERRKLYPDYKADRNAKHDKMTEEQKIAYQEMREQMDLLRTDILPTIGFKNIFWQFGYEADDLIASACATVRSRGESATIVSTDRDLYQLLSRRISIWNHKETITKERFFKEYGIEPNSWPKMLAIAGGKNGITGIKGVGEGLAIKFLQGNLPQHYKAFEAITKQANTWRNNMPLVTLPFPGTRDISFAHDDVNRRGWMRVLQRFGFSSLRHFRNEMASP